MIYILILHCISSNFCDLIFCFFFPDYFYIAKIFSLQKLCLILFAIRKFLKSPKTTDPNKKKLHIFPIFTNIVTHQYMVQSNQFNAKFYMYTTCVYSETKNVYWCHNQYNTKNTWYWKTNQKQTFKIWTEKFNFCLFLYNKAL